MQKYCIPTKKGIFYTTNLSLVMQIMKEETESKKEQIQKEREETTSLNEEFQTLLENYIPENPLKAKFGGE